MGIRNIILWDHSRGTWQYDVFCLLIVAFIFLTPKAWFERKERLATQTSRIIVKASDFSPDKSALNKQAKELSGNENAEVIGFREKKNAAGEIYYEIDIR